MTLNGRAFLGPGDPDVGGPTRVTVPRVLRVITRLNVGGPARQEIFLTGALERRGFGTELAYGEVGTGEGELVPADGLHTRIPELKRQVDPLADVRAGWALRRLIRSRNPDVVHTHMAKAGALGRLAAHRAGVPVVIHTFHGHVLEGYFARPVTAAFLAVERRLARWSDALVAVSPAIRDELLELRIGAASQWRVVPVGLELEGLLESALGTGEARQRLGLPENGAVVGIVGRLVPIKDHVTFLEAAARIVARRPDVTFVVAGDGELRSALEAQGRGMLGDRIRFLGWVLDLPTLYAAMDVVVLTSRNEGTPVSLIEAGAAAKPVVCTSVGGVDDVVRHDVTGLLTPARDPVAIAAAVLRLLQDPGLRRSMGEAARGWVPGRFLAERLADDLANLYRELIARAPDRRPPLHGSTDEAG